MSGISLMVIIHALNVSLEARPVRQNKRKSAPDRIQAIKEETEKLHKARFIKEVQYLDWLSNVVMVKKASGKWRMCVNFIDLNKTCPKDSFPLSAIDRLVDSFAGHRVLNFMDAFSRYNQINMKLSDQEKMMFITEEGVYCCRAMPFGLKNAGKLTKGW